MYIPLKTGVHIVDQDHCHTEYKDLDPRENRQFKIVVDDTVICAGETKYWLNSDAKVGSDACQVNLLFAYRKVPKFSDARKLCCNLPKIQTKRPNLRAFCQKDANEIANSE